jgi:hypothetical protein
VLSYADSSAAAGTTYKYAVQAFDAAGNHSAPGTPVSVTTPASSRTRAERLRSRDQRIYRMLLPQHRPLGKSGADQDR